MRDMAAVILANSTQSPKDGGAMGSGKCGIMFQVGVILQTLFSTHETGNTGLEVHSQAPT